MPWVPNGPSACTEIEEDPNSRQHDTGQEVPSPFGPQPMGVAIFDAERMMVMGGDGRTALSSVLKRVFVAYCGNYTFDGTKLVTRADSASGPELIEDQVRHIQFDGPRRMTACRVRACLPAWRAIRPRTPTSADRPPYDRRRAIDQAGGNFPPLPPSRTVPPDASALSAPRQSAASRPRH
jgi:hypothetical protein